MRGVRVGEASNPGPVTTRSASRILATQVDSSGIEHERDLGSGCLTRDESDDDPELDLKVDNEMLPSPTWRRPSRRLVLVPGTGSARSQSFQIPPTVVDSPPPSNVLDAPEFDSTIEETDGVDCCEPVAQVPSLAQQELRAVPYTGRFAALIDDFDPTVEDRVPLGESDTDTIDGQSEADPEVVNEVEFVVPDVMEPLPSGHVGAGMASMDEVDLISSPAF